MAIAAKAVDRLECTVVRMTSDAVTAVVVIVRVGFIITGAAERLAGAVLMLACLVVTDFTDIGGGIILRTEVIAVNARVIRVNG